MLAEQELHQLRQELLGIETEKVKIAARQAELSDRLAALQILLDAH